MHSAEIMIDSHCGYVFTREGIGRVADEQTRLTYSTGNTHTHSDCTALSISNTVSIHRILLLEHENRQSRVRINTNVLHSISQSVFD